MLNRLNHLKLDDLTPYICLGFWWILLDFFKAELVIILGLFIMSTAYIQMHCRLISIRPDRTVPKGAEI